METLSGTTRHGGGRIKSLRSKILLAYLPIIGLGLIAIFSVQEYRHFDRNYDGLIGRLHEISTLQRATLVMPVWSFDEESINLSLTAISRDPDFESVLVTDALGHHLAGIGPHEKAAKDPRLRITWPLESESVNNSRSIGSVTLTFHANRLKSQLFDRLIADGVELVVLLVLLSAVTIVLTQRIIGRPLSRLHASIQLLQRNGERRPVDWQASDEMGEVIQAYNTMLAQQALAETELRDSREELALLLASTSEGIFGIDLDGQCTFCNPSCASLLGYDGPNDLLGQHMAQHLLGDGAGHSQPAARKGAFFQGSGADDISAADTETFLRRDGASLPVEYSANPIMHDGTAVGTVVSFTDISARLADREEHARLERQLRHSQKLETIGTLAGGIAHDFNNILMPIVGYVDMMLPKTRTQPELHDNLRRVAKGAERAADLVRQILTFSRQLEDEDVRDNIQLQGVVNEALKLIRPSVPASVLIENAVDAGCPRVLANATQIHQLIINLCTNAAQSMPNGGTIKIRLSVVDLDEDQAARMEQLQPGPHVLLSVSDTGIGMNEETLERIFEPFFTTKEIGQGSGLGLSMAHGIVRNHDGHLDVKSEPGMGSVFEVYFPVAEGNELAMETVSAAVMGGDERILFVDDEEMITEMVEAMLPARGYQVSCFQNGADALAELHDPANSYDLVITDLTMPRMNGDQLAEALVEIRPDLPVIIITGFSSGLSDKRLAQLNIREVLHKPLLRADLDAAIQRALGAGKPAQVLAAEA